MANNRPIRRGRIPFRRPQRPKRWGASVDAMEFLPEIGQNGGLISTVIPSALTDAEAGSVPVQTFLVGEFDVAPWADEQEVRLDRIVGSIGIAGVVGDPNPDLPVNPFVVRMGLIVNEELTDDGTADEVRRNLWDYTDLQEAEWMWLHQSVILPARDTNPTVSEALGYVSFNLPVDIRNRRKIGQKDELALYCSYSYFASSSLGPPSTFNVRIVPAVRMVMVSK